MSVRRALAQVTDSNVNVLCRATIGNPLGLVMDVSELNSDKKVNIEHNEGEVILIIFYASWCAYSKTAMKNTQKLVIQNK